MRIRPWYTFVAILVLFVLALWIALPGTALDVGGIKTKTNLKLGLDLEGGLHAVLQARPAPGQRVDGDVLSGLRDTIERRVNALGVSEPSVQTQGSDKIVVELPGVQDPQAAVNVLKQTALLELVGSQGPLPEGSIVTTSLGGPQSVGLNPDGSPISSNATPSAGNPAVVGTAGAGSSAAGVPSVVATDTGAAVTANGTPAVSASTVGAGTPAPDVTGAVGTPNATAAASPPAATTTADGQPIYQTIVQGKDLADAFPQTGQTGNLVVGFKLTDAGANAFGDYTGSHTGQYLNVVVDKRVINSARINSRIDQSGIIEGLDRLAVNDLVVQLKSGRLAVPLDLIQTQTVGPTLGQDSINKSLIAGLLGLAAVAFFMIAFYRLPGLIAVLALIVYSAVTFALFKLFGIVLTLAGIAGFILSIGMAVDANVLIFARMKEELRAGRGLRAAIDGGFEHAWPSIRDSNVSTTITCLILYVFGGITGTSVVRGFSLTLLIGVLVSMFSAIVVTRTFMSLLLQARGLARNKWLFNAESLTTVPTAARGATGD